MPHTLQAFFERSTTKAAEDLLEAINRLPEDKRAWSPMGDARTALNQLAECAILNGSTAEMLKTHTFAMEGGFEAYFEERAKLAADETACKALFAENTAKAIAAIKEVPDEDLELQVNMPWGPMAVAQIVSYPFWNMCYHEGQINYIASMLGCLD